jgi:branched-chain amino acid transport system substrate-binding protein
LNRRELLKLAALSAVPGALGSMASRAAFAQGSPIQLACPVPMSGPFAANGKFADLGMKLVVRQYGKVLGARSHTRRSTPRASRRRPCACRRSRSRRACASSRAAFCRPNRWPWARKCRRRRRVHHDGRRRRDHRQGLQRATFRWSVPTFGAIEQTVRPLIGMLPKAKRWYTITPQYVFGDGLLSAAKAIFKEKGIEHVGNSYHSLTEKEFSGYLTNAAAAKPDVLLILNFGSQSSDTLRQAVSFGMKRNCTILLAWASGLEQFEALGADICDGVYFGAQYWHGIDSPLNRDLVKRANAAFKANPNYSLAGSYICSKILLDAMVKAGTAEPKKVIAAMEG